MKVSAVNQSFDRCESKRSRRNLRVRVGAEHSPKHLEVNATLDPAQDGRAGAKSRCRPNDAEPKHGKSRARLRKA
jgi:hypothetical protein